LLLIYSFWFYRPSIGKPWAIQVRDSSAFTALSSTRSWVRQKNHGTLKDCGMVPKRICASEAPWYRHFSAAFSRWHPGQNWSKPRLLHLAKYWTNHNHREFNGHRFWPHAYRGTEYNWSYWAVFWQPRGRGNDISGHAEDPAAWTVQRRGRHIVPIVT